MSRSPAHHLFDVYGVELEYMIVSRQTLDVRPIADELLKSFAGTCTAEVANGPISYSNELVLHLVELKVGAPVGSLDGLAPLFHQHIAELNGRLQKSGARLMPGGSHPWMNPLEETRLWPHEGADIYATFDRIFGCRAHGWANLQALHLNLPFANDSEFAKLHAAVRVLMPIMPALAASSPFFEAKAAGWLDGRLDAYRRNSSKIPVITGLVIPEPVFSQAAYRREILDRIYSAIAPHDPDGTITAEWLNARGAIARFERNTIEIRILDMQECPRADLAICHAVSSVLRELTSERWAGLAEQKAWSEMDLQAILLETARHGDRGLIRNPEYARLFGWNGKIPCSAGDLWQHLVRQTVPPASEHRRVLATILREGPLARRLVAAAGSKPSLEKLRVIYRHLCDCLSANRMFHAQADKVPADV